MVERTGAVRFTCGEARWLERLVRRSGGLKPGSNVCRTRFTIDGPVLCPTPEYQVVDIDGDLPDISAGPHDVDDPLFGDVRPLLPSILQRLGVLRHAPKLVPLLLLVPSDAEVGHDEVRRTSEMSHERERTRGLGMDAEGRAHRRSRFRCSEARWLGRLVGRRFGSRNGRVPRDHFSSRQMTDGPLFSDQLNPTPAVKAAKKVGVIVR